MWNLSLPWWEFVLRGVIACAFPLVVSRMAGKRRTGRLAPFALVLRLILGNTAPGGTVFID